MNAVPTRLKLTRGLSNGRDDREGADPANAHIKCLRIDVPARVFDSIVEESWRSTSPEAVRTTQAFLWAMVDPTGHLAGTVQAGMMCQASETPDLPQKMLGGSTVGSPCDVTMMSMAWTKDEQLTDIAFDQCNTVVE